MRNSFIWGIVITAVILLPAVSFAQHGPSGETGMLSAGEMRAFLKAGGKFDRNGMDGTLHGKAVSANEIRTTVQGSYKEPTKAINDHLTANPGNSHFGLSRGKSEAMGRAVSAFQLRAGAGGSSGARGGAQGAVGGSSGTDVSSGSWSGPQSFATRGAEKDAADEKWRRDGYPKNSGTGSGVAVNNKGVGSYYTKDGIEVGDEGAAFMGYPEGKAVAVNGGIYNSNTDTVTNLYSGQTTKEGSNPGFPSVYVGEKGQFIEKGTAQPLNTRFTPLKTTPFQLDHRKIY